LYYSHPVGTRSLSKVRRIQIRLRGSQVDSVEQVERFSPELQTSFLRSPDGNRKSLDECRINPSIAWASQEIPPQGAGPDRVGTREHGGIHCPLEPLIFAEGIWQAYRRTVGSLARLAISIKVSTFSIESEGPGHKKFSGLQIPDGVELPASK